MSVYKLLISACISILMCMPAAAQDPISDVIAMLDTDGALRTGTNEQDGYYLVSLAFSDLSSEIKAREDAKLAALKSLSEFLNGSAISGKSSAITEYISEQKNGATQEYSYQKFVDVVESQFKGNLNTSKTIKQGRYKGRYFVAIAITESDTNKKSVLVTDNKPLLAEKGNKFKTVTSKGFASVKSTSFKKARNVAIQDALRNAVQQANGLAIKGKSGRLGEAITMAISSQSQGYVRSYEILDENNKRGELIVVIVAEVDEGKLVKDARFFLDAFSSPTFGLNTTDDSTKNWIKKELELLGFVFQSNMKTASHIFSIEMNQNVIENHLGKMGIETEYSIELEEKHSTTSLFTIANDVKKSRIYISPESRAKQVSKIAALKSLKKQLAPEIISALAKAAERGRVYQIVVHNANQVDLKIFKHVLNTGTTGQVEDWQWKKTSKSLTLQFRYQGPLSEAMDQGLKDLYATYKTEGKNRRPSSDFISKNVAEFTIKVKG